MTMTTLDSCDAGDRVVTNFPKFTKDDWGNRKWFDCMVDKKVAMVVIAPKGRLVVFDDCAYGDEGAEVVRDFMEQHRDD